MSTTTPTTAVALGDVDTAEYERFDGFDAIIDGEPDARVAWLRTTAGGEGVLYAGLFTVEPSSFRYTFAGDETVHVLDGEVIVALDGGETVRLVAGTIASFPKGARSTWTVLRALRKVFVISG